MVTELLALLERLFPALALRSANRVDKILGEFDNISEALLEEVRSIDAEIGKGRALVARKREAFEAAQMQQAQKANLLNAKAEQAVRVRERIQALVA